MWRTIVTKTVLVVLTATLVACSGDSGSDLEKALCADLEQGMTPAEIARSAADTTEPERFAQILYGATKDVCPEHRDDPDVVGMLAAWNLDG